MIVLLCGILALLALSATPATAGAPAPDSALCTAWETDGAGVFDSVGSLTAVSSVARGGDVVREPNLNATYETVAMDKRKKGGPGFRATVPVWFHVVSDGEIGNVTQAQIDAQITVLNLAFAGFYGGAKSGFRFELAGVTRTDNADWLYAGIGGSGERPMKKALHRGGFETLNVYSTTAGPYLGWAYLPGLSDSLLYLDGVVSDWEAMPGTSDTYAGQVRPRSDADARGRPLAQPRAHVLRRLQREGRLRRRHAGDEGADERLPRGQGHLLRAGARPDPQLHGLLVRRLLRGVHARPGRAAQEAWLTYRT